jgi:hypothetical protein
MVSGMHWDTRNCCLGIGAFGQKGAAPARATPYRALPTIGQLLGPGR